MSHRKKTPALIYHRDKQGNAFWLRAATIVGRGFCPYGVLFGNGAGGPLMRFGPFRAGRDSCVFSSLVSSRQPQFCFCPCLS
jgi:hypothetical protein